MKDELFEFFTDHSVNHGLLVAEAPTGYGKTHQTVQAMCDCIQAGGKEKFLFVTNLLKNLPMEELERAYQRAGREADFHREVLKLATPVETIGEVIDKVEIPSAFRSRAYEDLKAGFARLKACKSVNRQLRRDLEKQEMDKLRKELEPAFRHELQDYLKEYVSNSPAEQREAIRHQKQYKWIRDFYPAVFWNEYKIILMSVKKLLVRNIPLVEPSFPCLSERMLEGRIVCMDEFDASKAVILDHLIDQALDMRVDYLELFRTIHDKMGQHRLCRELQASRDLYEARGTRRTWSMLVQEAEDLYQYGALDLSIKTAGQGIDKGRNFLFHDSSYHTICSGGKSYIRTVRDDEAGQVQIYFEDRETYEQHRDEPRIRLHQLLRRIHYFLRHLQNYVYGWGKVYTELENQNRTELDELYLHSKGVETIYQDYGLTGGQIDLMTDELEKKGSGGKRDVITPDLSFYETGFRFFKFLDADHHNTKTDLQYFQLQNTPEKVLLYLCTRNKVVGLSATAALPTVTGNYDLEYVHSRLGKRYRELSRETRARIGAQLNKQWAAYADGRVRVELTVLDGEGDGLELEKRLEAIFESKALAKKYKLRLTEDEFCQKRYCDILACLKAFWTHEDIRSFLCLNKMLPESGKEKMDLELLKQCAEDLRKQFTPESSGELCVLRSSSDFDEDKQAVMDALSCGEKRFILSSYQTLGAGQNLQYPVVDRQGLVSLLEDLAPGDARLQEKDVDAIYLGDDTHTAVMLNGEDGLSGRDLLKFCFQAECLRENSEISRRELNQMVKEAVSCYSGNRNKNGMANTLLKECPSFHRQVSRDMIQAVGRMNRTFLKNPSVYLFVSRDALIDMDPSCLRGRQLTPELQTMAAARMEMGKEYRVPNEARNRAERITDDGNIHIQRMLRAEWTPDSMELWRALRNTVLTHPRASEELWETDPIIHKYYIRLGEAQSRYFFAQKGDFSDTLVALDGDRSEFVAGLDWGWHPSEVSEEAARLPLVLAYPGMREYFETRGWATEFGTGEYILSPVLFQNIYKGALGEEAGRFILERELAVRCRELEDPVQFEVFDYGLGNGVYLDFKHWKARSSFDERRMRRKILDKLESIGGGRVLIVNLVTDGAVKPDCNEDMRLVEISGLLLPDGSPNREALVYIKEMLT